MKTVYFGDSITAGFKKLEDHKNVINLGVSGNKINNLIGRIEDVIRVNPDQLLLMIGINDYLNINNYWGETITYNIIEMFQVLLKLIHQNLPNTRVIVLPILPVSMNINNKILKRYNSDIKQLNNRIREILTYENISFYDIYPHFLDRDQLAASLTTDGVHLSQKGYQLYYQLIQEFLVES